MCRPVVGSSVVAEPGIYLFVTAFLVGAQIFKVSGIEFGGCILDARIFYFDTFGICPVVA